MLCCAAINLVAPCVWRSQRFSCSGRFRARCPLSAGYQLLCCRFNPRMTLSTAARATPHCPGPYKVALKRHHRRCQFMRTGCHQTEGTTRPTHSALPWPISAPLRPAHLGTAAAAAAARPCAALRPAPPAPRLPPPPAPTPGWGPRVAPAPPPAARSAAGGRRACVRSWGGRAGVGCDASGTVRPRVGSRCRVKKNAILAQGIGAGD